MRDNDDNYDNNDDDDDDNDDDNNDDNDDNDDDNDDDQARLDCIRHDLSATSTFHRPSNPSLRDPYSRSVQSG